MKLFQKITTVLVLLTALSFTATAEEAGEGEVYSALVPIVFYTSDTGFAGGGLYQRFYPSGINMSLAGFYTQQNQINVFYNSSFFTPDNPWWIQYGGSGHCRQRTEGIYRESDQVCRRRRLALSVGPHPGHLVPAGCSLLR